MKGLFDPRVVMVHRLRTIGLGEQRGVAGGGRGKKRENMGYAGAQCAPFL